MTEQSEKVLVAGATGNVGRHVVSGLLGAGADVRALTRDPDHARLPQSAEVVRGDLSEPGALGAHLSGVGAVFLVWPFLTAEAAPAVLEALEGHACRVVYLSSMGVRDDGVVRAPYGAASRSLVHEADVAGVAVRALTEEGHGRKKYPVTGPEALTQVEQVRVIGEAIGRPLRWEEVPPETARRGMLDAGWPPPVVDGILDAHAGFVEEPEPVTPTVEEVTGRPARPFREWAADHAGDFR